MAGTLALTKAELRRLMHNRRYFIFTVAFPVILYLLIGRQVTAQAYGVAFGAYYMISMATFGAFSGALNGNAQRISQEKKEGWIRQLRLTPLPANAYVVTKILVSLATTVPAIVIVLLLGRFYGNVHLPAWQWPVIAVTVWFGSTIFAALAVGKVGQFTPTYEAVKIGSDVIGGAAVPAGLASGLVVWLGIFVALATAAVRTT